MFKRLVKLTAIVTATSFSLSSIAADLDAKNSDIFNYQDIFELEYAGAPQLNKSGRYVIYERRSMDIMSDSTRYNLWQVDLDGNNHQPLLSGKSNYRMPTLSPDGEKLAYVSSEEGSNQLYVRWLASGRTAKVTNLQQFPSSITWSPNGQWLAFSMFKPSKPASLFKDMPKKPKGATWAGNATYIDSLIYRTDNGGFSRSGYSHIYVVPSDGGSARQITSGDFNHGGQLNWTKDSKNIIFAGNRSKDWQHQPVESDIYQVDIASGDISNIVNRPGPDANPRINKRGDKIAYIRFDDRKLSSQNAHVYVMNVDGSDVKPLTDKLDRNITGLKWAPNDKGIYFSYDDFGQKYVGYVDLKGKVKQKVAKIGGQALGRPYTSGDFLPIGDNKLVITKADIQRPADLAVVSRKGKLAQLTHLNEDVLAHKSLPTMEALTVKSSVDQREIQSWVALPPNFDASKKYPLILEIHGGPHAAYGPNYSAEVQLMAAKGYIVVWANPRGSTSYGEDFANLIHHNYPSQDHNDLMDVVDGVIAKGYVDENQLFITGGSGGGTLASWAIGKTNRFKAAVVAKPVINWMSFSLTADMYPYFSQYWMSKMPWDNAEKLWQHSPLSLVGNVKTPTLLLTGEVDYRTPMSETEQYYQALQLQKVPSAMVRVPKASHSIYAKPSNLIQKVGYIISWFEKYRTEK